MSNRAPLGIREMNHSSNQSGCGHAGSPGSLPAEGKLQTAGIAAAWTAVFVALSVRCFTRPERQTTFDVYSAAGGQWLHAQPIYKGGMGFVYSPVVALLFSPLSLLPRSPGTMAWLAVNLGIFVWGLGEMLKTDVMGRFSPWSARARTSCWCRWPWGIWM